MMPFWTMTLGRLIFADGHIVVPYRNIAMLAGGLVVPLMVGSRLQILGHYKYLVGEINLFTLYDRLVY